MKPQSKTLSAKQAGTDDIEEGTYRVNEIFYSVQGEGHLSGYPMTFVRFAHCNLRCSVRNVGFDCDTEFESGALMTPEEILTAVADAGAQYDGWILLTGGEPALQIDSHLIDALRGAGYSIAVETNGTVKLTEEIDWICVSPKSADHTLRQRHCNEYKLVRAYGQLLPTEPPIASDFWLVSPAFNADGTLNSKDAAWCVDLVKENPAWRLSLQTHKMIGVR